MLKVLLNFLTSGLNWLFGGICHCVFHCFRFVELFIYFMDFVVYTIKLLLGYNSAIFSRIIYVVKNFFEVAQNLNSLFKEAASNTTDHILNTPQRVANYTEKVVSWSLKYTVEYGTLFGELFIRLYESLLVVFSSINSLFGKINLELAEWLSAIPENLSSIFVFIGEFGLKMIILITEVTSQFLFLLLKTIVDAILYVSTYVLSFTEWVKILLSNIFNPTIDILASSGEFIAKTSTDTFISSIQGIYTLISSIGNLGTGICWTVLYIPNIFLDIITEGINYVNRIFTDIFYVIADMIVNKLNLQEFLFGLFLIIFFIWFVAFLIQNRGDAEYSLMPTQLFIALYEKLTAIFSTHALPRPIQNGGRNNVRRVAAIENNRIIASRQEMQQEQQMFQQREQQQQQQQQQNFQQQQAQEEKGPSPHFLLNTETTEMSCVVCQDKKKSVVLLPCKHLCLCDSCLDAILRMAYSEQKCPLCRKRIRDYINVYM